MLAYDFDALVQIAPESYSLIKEASVTEEFPVDSAASALASAMRVEYLTKVAHTEVSAVDRWNVEKAVIAYGLLEKVAELSTRVSEYAREVATQRAYNAEDTLRIKEAAAFVTTESLRPDLEKVASACARIVDDFEGQGLTISEDVQRYSGMYQLDKQATELSLKARESLTKCAEYSALLGLVQGDFPVEKLNEMGREKRAAFAQAVITLDKANHYPGDFYKEAFVKKASVNVTLAGKSYDMAKIASLGKSQLGDILGADVAGSMTGDLAYDKAVIDSLPMDSKNTLGRFMSHV